MARPRSFDPDEAVNAAMILFWRRGYESVSFDELVGETGASRKGLYALWPDKKALLVAALQRYRHVLGEQMLAGLEDGNAGLDALTSFWRRFEEAAREPGWSGCLAMRTATVRIAAEPDVAAEVTAFLDRLSAALGQALRRAAAQGEVLSAPSPETRAHQVLAVIAACSAIGAFEGFSPRIAGLIEAGREASGIPARGHERAAANKDEIA